jgi:hypothetical protein
LVVFRAEICDALQAAAGPLAYFGLDSVLLSQSRSATGQGRETQKLFESCSCRAMQSSDFTSLCNVGTCVRSAEQRQEPLPKMLSRTKRHPALTSAQQPRPQAHAVTLQFQLQRKGRLHRAGLRRWKRAPWALSAARSATGKGSASHWRVSRACVRWYSPSVSCLAAP